MRRQHTTEEKEPRDPEVSAGDVIAYLSKLPQPASIRQIAHGMELKHSGRRFLPRVIQQLKRRGDIEETYGGRFRLAEQKPAPSPSSRRAARAPETAAAMSGAPVSAPAPAPSAAVVPQYPPCSAHQLLTTGSCRTSP